MLRLDSGWDTPRAEATRRACVAFDLCEIFGHSFLSGRREPSLHDGLICTPFMVIIMTHVGFGATGSSLSSMPLFHSNFSGYKLEGG